MRGKTHCQTKDTNASENRASGNAQLFENHQYGNKDDRRSDDSLDQGSQGPELAAGLALVSPSGSSGSQEIGGEGITDPDYASDATDGHSNNQRPPQRL